MALAGLFVANMKYVDIRYFYLTTTKKALKGN